MEGRLRLGEPAARDSRSEKMIRLGGRGLSPTTLTVLIGRRLRKVRQAHM